MASWMSIPLHGAEQREWIVEEVEHLLRGGVTRVHPRLVMERLDARMGRRRPNWTMIEKTFAEMVAGGFLVELPRESRNQRRLYCRPSSEPQPQHASSVRAVALHDIGTVAKMLGIGRTKVAQLIADGDLESVRIGTRRLVSDAQLRRFVGGLVTAATARGGAG